MAYQRRGRLSVPLKKQVIPVADLGLPIGGVSDLVFPDDLPVVLALQVVQTPTGVRIVQSSPSGQPSSNIPIAQPIRGLTTEGAGNTGTISFTGFSGCTAFAEIIALTGAPTNIKYRAEFSLDGGTTWYQSADATSTTVGVVTVAIGSSSGAGTAGNSIIANTSFAYPLPPLVRIAWVFTAGTAPTVQHRITGIFR